MEVVEIEVGLISLNPRNYRNAGDYIDPALRAEITANGCELFAPLVVTPADGGRYEVVSGNRSFYNLLKAADAAGVKLTTVPCVVKEYATESEHLLALGLANELQLAMSPIDLACWYADLRNAGMKQVDVAKRCNTTQPRVSKLTQLLTLPESLQDAVHHAAQSAHYSKLDPKVLDAEGVRYTVADDGTVTIVGLTASAAFQILGFRPKKKGKAQAAFDAFLDANAENLIATANTLTAAQFARVFENRAIAEGALPKPEPVAAAVPTTVQEAAPTVQETAPEAAETAAPVEGKAKPKKAASVASGEPSGVLDVDPFADVDEAPAKPVEAKPVEAKPVEAKPAAFEEPTEEEVGALANAFRDGNIRFVPEWNIILARLTERDNGRLANELFALGILKF